MRGKGKSELLFLDHNVLKCDLPFSLRFPSCPVFYFFSTPFSFVVVAVVEGRVEMGKESYIHKIALSGNSRSMFGLAEKKSFMNLGSGSWGVF